MTSLRRFVNKLDTTEIIHNVLLNKRFMSTTNDLSKYNATVESLFKGVISNKRSDLARSITLIETSNPEKKVFAQLLLNKVLHKLKRDREMNKKICLRVG